MKHYVLADVIIFNMRSHIYFERSVAPCRFLQTLCMLHKAYCMQHDTQFVTDAVITNQLSALECFQYPFIA